MSLQDELQAELEGLRLAVVKQLRKALENEQTASPAYLEAARKMLNDLQPRPSGPRLPPPLVGDLPFPDEVE